MKTISIHANTIAILTLTSVMAFSGCSQKPSSEEIAAEVKATLAEEKSKEQAAATEPIRVAEVAAQAPARQPVPKPVAKAKPVTQEKSVQVAPAPAPKIICSNCGEVVSVTEIEQEGSGSGVGVIAGGLVGGALGNQVGQGRGKDLATIAGVVGGALAGNKIEKTMKKTKFYNVTVKMENGTELILRHDTAPGVLAGDKIKVEAEHVVKL